MAALYAATAFVKHSKTYRGEKTNLFVAEIRQIIFDILIDELADQQHILSEHRPKMAEISVDKF